MFKVVMALDSYKWWGDQVPPVKVASVQTEAEAQSLLFWVERDLQKHGLYVDELRCVANDHQGYKSMKSVLERMPYPTKGYNGEDLRYIGCIFYLEKTDEPQA